MVDQTAKHPSRISRQIPRVTALAAVLVTIAALLWADYQSAPVPIIDRNKGRLWGIVPFDFGLMLVPILTAFMFRTGFLAVLRSATIVSIVIAAMFWGILGVLLGNPTVLVISDLKSILWFFGGVALQRLMDFSRISVILMSLFVVGSSFVGYWALVNAVPLDGRLVDPIFYHYNELLIGIVSCLFMRFAMRSGLAMIAVVVSVATTLYGGAILSATRSIVAEMAVLLSLSLVSLTALLPDFSKLGFSRSRYRVVVVASIVCVATVAALVQRDIESGGVRLSSRMIDYGDAGDSRVYELVENVRQVTVSKLLIGGGLGYPFVGVGGVGETGNLHIAFAGLLPRVGVFAFFAICLLAFLYIPCMYVVYCFRILSSSRQRSAMLVCAPAYLTWLALTLVSGGFTHYALMGMGVIWGTYRSICLGLAERPTRQSRRSALPKLAPQSGPCDFTKVSCQEPCDRELELNLGRDSR